MAKKNELNQTTLPNPSEDLAALPHTVGALFLNRCERNPDRSFLHLVSGETLSYEKAMLRVANTVSQLKTIGLVRGDSIVACFDHPLPAIYFVLACEVMGIAHVSISPQFSVEYVKSIQEKAKAKWIFCPSSERAVYFHAAGLNTLCYRDLSGSNIDGITQFELDSKITMIRALENLKNDCAQIHGNDPCTIIATSGSTGQPKLVVRPHSTALNIARTMGPQLMTDNSLEPHRVAAIATFNHGFGHNMLVLALTLGAELAIPTNIDIQVSLDELRRLDPTILPTVPRVLRSLYKQHADQMGEMSNVRLFGPRARFITTGGALPDPTMLNYVRSQGIDVRELYGSAETSIMALAPLGESKEGYAGKVIPSIDARIAEDGEIQVRSSSGNRLGYYYNDEPANQEAFTPDGYFMTGDLGEIDADGYLRILGRKRDLFNTPEGTNIHPARIEALVEALPWVEQCCLVGDGKPYLSALIVIRPEKIGLSLASSETDGLIRPQSAAALYAKAGNDLHPINLGLEKIEKIHRFYLFDQKFPLKAYSIIGVGKIKRTRKTFDSLYGERITELYASQIEANLNRIDT